MRYILVATNNLYWYKIEVWVKAKPTPWLEKITLRHTITMLSLRRILTTEYGLLH